MVVNNNLSEMKSNQDKRNEKDAESEYLLECDTTNYRDHSVNGRVICGSSNLGAAALSISIISSLVEKTGALGNSTTSPSPTTYINNAFNISTTTESQTQGNKDKLLPTIGLVSAIVLITVITIVLYKFCYNARSRNQLINDNIEMENIVDEDHNMNIVNIVNINNERIPNGYPGMIVHR